MASLAHGAVCGRMSTVHAHKAERTTKYSALLDYNFKIALSELYPGGPISALFRSVIHCKPGLPTLTKFTIVAFRCMGHGHEPLSATRSLNKKLNPGLNSNEGSVGAAAYLSGFSGCLAPAMATS